MKLASLIGEVALKGARESEFGFWKISKSHGRVVLVSRCDYNELFDKGMRIPTSVTKCSSLASIA